MVNKNDALFDGVVASRGGIPLIEQGALIEAIRSSGGTDSPDRSKDLERQSTRKPRIEAKPART